MIFNYSHNRFLIEPKTKDELVLAFECIPKCRTPRRFNLKELECAADYFNKRFEILNYMLEASSSVKTFQLSIYSISKLTLLNFLFITNILRLFCCSKGSRIVDPCLPKDFTDEGMFKKRRYYLKGTGRFRTCQSDLITLLNTTATCKRKPCSLNGVHQPSINFRSSEFYGFAEFWYSTQDVLRMGASYEGDKMDQMAVVSATLYLCAFYFSEPIFTWY